MKLTFLGGAGTVTGSKCVVDTGTTRILLDCGLFQGLKRLRERNWQRLPFDVATLDAIVLTHAHLDHTGYLPVLARGGFRGNVYCTRATAELVEILLPDSAHLQEEEAGYANKHRFSKHKPALPLYTRDDAAAALKLLRPVDWTERAAIKSDVSVRFSAAGHLLGAASVLVESAGRRVLFSGDLGRPDDAGARPAASCGLGGHRIDVRGIGFTRPATPKASLPSHQPRGGSGRRDRRAGSRRGRDAWCGARRGRRHDQDPWRVDPGQGSGRDGARARRVVRVSDSFTSRRAQNRALVVAPRHVGRL